VAAHGTPISVVAANRFAQALLEDGTVWVWGANDLGAFANGSFDFTTTTSVALQIPDLSDVVALTGGTMEALALKADGTVWRWGHQRFLTPTLLATDGAGSSAYGESEVVLQSDGDVWLWGAYPGDGSGVWYVNELRQVPLPQTIVAVATGGNHILALQSDGTLWSWGWNQEGQVGGGPASHVMSPIELSVDNVVAMAAGREHSFALQADGTIWGWGKNDTGALGNGTTTNQLTPAQLVHLEP